MHARMHAHTHVRTHAHKRWFSHLIKSGDAAAECLGSGSCDTCLPRTRQQRGQSDLVLQHQSPIIKTVPDCSPPSKPMPVAIFQFLFSTGQHSRVTFWLSTPVGWSMWACQNHGHVNVSQPETEAAVIPCLRGPSTARGVECLRGQCISKNSF